jgi:hypothetical protein
MKPEEQRLARELRAGGWSVNEIHRRLGVSKASVSVWVRNVELTPEARSRLVEKSRLGPIVAGERKAAAARRERQRWQDVGRGLARICDRDYAAGCMLYWAEGSKHRNKVKLTNSDPELLVFFMTFLRTYFHVRNEQVRVWCNLFADHLERQREIEDFWIDKLELSRDSLTKSTVNVYSKYSQKKRVNKLPYGTAALTVHSTRVVQTIYGSIQEIAGFDRPEWLD